jgi:K+-transporting ATPase A subunit
MEKDACAAKSFENISLLMNKIAIFRKYYLYKALSKMIFGKMQKRYKQKRAHYKQLVSKIRDIRKNHNTKQ